MIANNFFIRLESYFGEPLVNLAMLLVHILATLFLGHHTDSVAMVALRCGTHDIAQCR